MDFCDHLSCCKNRWMTCGQVFADIGNDYCKKRGQPYQRAPDTKCFENDEIGYDDMGCGSISVCCSREKIE
eukprot:Awhi_evm1s7241